MPDFETELPKVRRSKWSRIRLWSCLALTAVFLGVVAWSNTHQSTTMKAIESAGGTVFEPFNDGALSYRFRLFVRSVMRQPYPKDLFLGPQTYPAGSLELMDFERLQDEDILQINLRDLGHLRMVEMSGPHVTDRGFAHIASNPLVHNVNCRRAKVTDAGLAAIRGNSNLGRLDISGNNITNGGMSSLAQVSSLSGLCLSDTLITDQGLRDLAASRLKLWTLSIGSTDVTDEGLSCLLSFPRLQGIHLDVLQCTDSGIAHLQARAVPLESLGVRTCSARKQARLRASGMEDQGQIDDEMVARISRIQSLKLISLDGTSAFVRPTLSPAAVHSLKSMPLLSYLSITGMHVAPEVIRQIRRELPMLTLTIRGILVK